MASWNIPCIAPDFPAIDSINIPGGRQGGEGKNSGSEGWMNGRGGGASERGSEGEMGGRFKERKEGNEKGEREMGGGEGGKASDGRCVMTMRVVKLLRRVRG